MAFSEGLSDTGELTGRGNAYLRGSITGVGTFLGGILHTLRFLIPQYQTALIVAIAVIAFELLTLSWLRARFFGTGRPQLLGGSYGRLSSFTGLAGTT